MRVCWEQGLTAAGRRAPSVRSMQAGPHHPLPEGNGIPTASQPHLLALHLRHHRCQVAGQLPALLRRAERLHHLGRQRTWGEGDRGTLRERSAVAKALLVTASTPCRASLSTQRQAERLSSPRQCRPQRSGGCSRPSLISSKEVERVVLHRLACFICPSMGSRNATFCKKHPHLTRLVHIHPPPADATRLPCEAAGALAKCCPKVQDSTARSNIPRCCLLVRRL